MVYLELKVLQNLPEQERVTALRSVQEGLDPVVTETVADWREGVAVAPGGGAELQSASESVEPNLPAFRSVGGLAEQSTTRSECRSSETAVHSEAAVASC